MENVGLRWYRHLGSTDIWGQVRESWEDIRVRYAKIEI